MFNAIYSKKLINLYSVLFDERVVRFERAPVRLMTNN